MTIPASEKENLLGQPTVLPPWGNLYTEEMSLSCFSEDVSVVVVSEMRRPLK